MEDLLHLNASNKSSDKIKKFENLDRGTYLVKSFELKETPFGLRLFVKIDDFGLILPPRYSDKINSDEQLKELNDGKFKMIYRGKNKDEYNKLMIDFKSLGEDEAPGNDSSSSSSDDEEDTQPTKPPPKKLQSAKRARK